jgi:branched-chain amino acid transport system substrate-binding protein
VRRPDFVVPYARCRASRALAVWNASIVGDHPEKQYLDYKKHYKENRDFIPYGYTIDMWAKALDKAGSDDPNKVARVLEDMRYDGGVGEVWMRADDQQAMEPRFSLRLPRPAGRL